MGTELRNIRRYLAINARVARFSRIAYAISVLEGAISKVEGPNFKSVRALLSSLSTSCKRLKPDSVHVSPNAEPVATQCSALPHFKSISQLPSSARRRVVSAGVKPEVITSTPLRIFTRRCGSSGQV